MKYANNNSSNSYNLMATRYDYFFHYGWIDPHSSRDRFNRNSGKFNYREEDTLVDDLLSLESGYDF